MAPTVVLLHGLAATGPLNWDPIIESLAERFRVLALDHRGHGRGIRPDEPVSLEDCADDVAALLDVLGVRRALLVGYSMGGAIAQLTWRRHPHRVAGLVLLATAARFRIPPGSEAATRLLVEANRHNDRIPLVGHSATALRDAVQALGRFDSRGWVGTRYVPAIVLATSSDRVVAPELQHELAAHLAGGHTVEVAGGHLLPLTDHRRTATVLRRACDDLVADTGLGLPWWRSASPRLRLLARRLGTRLRRARP